MLPQTTRPLTGLNLEIRLRGFSVNEVDTHPFEFWTSGFESKGSRVRPINATYIPTRLGEPQPI